MSPTRANLEEVADHIATFSIAGVHAVIDRVPIS
jgi:hypothetical protein